MIALGDKWTFSSLIRVAELEVSDEGLRFDDRGVMFKLPRKVVNGQVQQDITDVLFILNESDCELNPIVHRDILNKAVELAFATRGGGLPQQSQGNNRQ